MIFWRQSRAASNVEAARLLLRSGNLTSHNALMGHDLVSTNLIQRVASSSDAGREIDPARTGVCFTETAGWLPESRRQEKGLSAPSVSLLG